MLTSSDGTILPYTCIMELQHDLFLRAAKGEEVPRPPVWLMRQAGRILPQYRAIRERLRDFKELVETPALAAEVTIQPVDELGVDAAIIFSDILVIPEALGLPYEMEEKRGPVFPNTIKTMADVARLRAPEDAAGQLHYVYDALEITRRDLAGRVPLIGFAGAPWTILAYMVEGKGSKTFSLAKKMLYTQPELAHQLLDRITETTLLYLRQKAAHGADLIQIFDSWAGILSPQQYQEFAIPYLRRLCEGLQPIPVTVFAKGAWFAMPEIAQLPCAVIGTDWHMDPQQVRQWIGPEKVLQGNMDPCQLYATPDVVFSQTQQMLAQFGRKHIANLGHGVYPDTPLASVKAFVEAVKSYTYPISQ